MNLVGKIFVFLIFCMSVVFMSFAVMIYATHKNWRQEVLRTEIGPRGEKIGWKKQLEDAQQKNVELQSQKNELQGEIATQEAAKRQEIAKLEAELNELNTQNESLEETYNANVKELSDLLTKVKDQQDILDSLREENGQMRGDIKETRGVIDRQLEEYMTLTEKLHQSEGERRRLEERRGQLLQELTLAERVLKANDLTKHTPIEGTPPPIDGVITAVKRMKDKIFVEVTVGSDDGIRQGNTMEVYRGGRYLGQIQIVRTTPDKSVGRVDRSRQQGEIRAKDRVETRRNLKFSADLSSSGS